MTNQNKRVILVTGASRGVGKGIAEGMARKGDIIICAARSQKKGSTVQQFGFEIQSSLDETVEKIKVNKIRIVNPIYTIFLATNLPKDLFAKSVIRKAIG